MSSNETISMYQVILEYMEGQNDSEYSPETIHESAVESAGRLEEIRTDRAINDALRAAIQKRKREIAELEAALEARTKSTS